MTHPGPEEQRLLALYRSDAPRLTIARAFARYQDAHGQREAARRLGITAGALYHYVSIATRLAPDLQAALEQGRLNFKEARALAGIRSHTRQYEVAQAFLDGRLTSHRVERVVNLARRNPAMPAEEVYKMALHANNNPYLPTPSPSPSPTPPPTPPSTPPTPDALADAVLKLAGELEALLYTKTPEVQRMKLVSSLRILKRRLDAVLRAYLD